MNLNFEYAIPSFIFCLIDLLVLRHANKEKAHSDKQKVFNIFGLVILLQQIASTIMTIQQRGAANVGFIIMNLSCIVLFCCMTASSQSLIRYTVTLEKDGDQASISFKILNAIPLILMIITCFASPWTHWIFYIDKATGMYQRGNLFVLQFVLPYLYFFIEMGYIARQKIKGKYVSMLVKQFVGFFFPSLLGVVVQMMGFVGGYSSIGISCGMILLYLDLYVDEMNDAKRLKEMEGLNSQLQQSNKSLLRVTSITDFFISSYSIANYCDIEKDTVTVLKSSMPALQGHEGEHHAFSRSILHYIKNNVAEEDQEMMRQQLSISYIKEHLENTSNYSFNFKDVSKENAGIYNCTVIRGEDKNHIAFGFKDVTKEIEKQIEEQTQLENALSMAEASNKAKTSFLFNMSHDIRTPMNAIIGFTTMAKKHIDDKEKVIDCIDKTKSASDLLLSLINNVLDMSRIESGNLFLNEDPSDVMLSFVNVETTMQELAKAKDISLNFDFKNINDRYVYVDIARIVRVFANIITNSIKYTKEGGRINVTCEQIGKENNKAIYQYTFSDNGIGMSPEFVEHAFDAFSRENTSTVSGIQGTGLGLAICKTFIEAMDGTIECQSEQGVGSTFIITLPLKIQATQNHTDPASWQVFSENGKPATDTEGLENKRILLVEDNELNMEIAVDILKDEGLIVETAEDGSIAVDMVVEKGPTYYDFILMDIQMPIMNGYEATRKIRELYPDDNIPIIALSANAFAEDKAASLEAGMNDHVAKPINIDQLNTALKNFI